MKKSLIKFLASLNEDELMDLRNYTGYNFRNINAVLRNNWSYEDNGQLTESKIFEFRQLAENIKIILSKFIMPDVNFIAFRGTTIDSFSSYGINSLDDLINLSDKFIYESGFVSTSLIDDTCYFKKNIGDGKNYNIKIRYLVSSESNDGALLIDRNTSYSVNQNEFLITKGSLFKVIDVKIDKDTDTAIMTVILIPKKVYELNKDKNRNNK